MRTDNSKDIVVIKFGGGLITHKSELKKPNLMNLEKMAHVVKELSNSYNVVLVHGAGSYGHLIAKKYDLQLGEVAGFGIKDGLTQDDAIKIVRNDMAELSGLIVDYLSKEGLESRQIIPHQNIRGTGMDFEIDMSLIKRIVGKGIPILWGDVVDCNSPKNFGILSGDDIAARIAIELEGVISLVFAMSGADGVMTEPPENPKAELIKQLSESTNFESLHRTEEDVTGGIMYKVSRGYEVSKHINCVYIVNGEYPQRVISAAQGIETRGTRIG